MITTPHAEFSARAQSTEFRTSTPRQSPNSPTPSSNERPLSVEADLIQHLLVFKHCSEELHALQYGEHLEKVKLGQSACQSLKDLQYLLDPSLPQNTDVPDILKRDVLQYGSRTQWLFEKSVDEFPAKTFESNPLSSPTHLKRLYEGRPNDTSTPQRVCLHFHEKSAGQAPIVSRDIDSATIHPTSLAAIKGCLNWTPFPHRVLNLRSQIHGLPVDQA